jgi:hypothetical protein
MQGRFDILLAQALLNYGRNHCGTSGAQAARVSKMAMAITWRMGNPYCLISKTKLLPTVND